MEVISHTSPQFRPAPKELTVGGSESYYLLNSRQVLLALGWLRQ